MKLLVTVISVALSILSAVAMADISDGTVLAYDRVAQVLVLKDKTVWPLELLETPAPNELKAGDRIEVVYQSNEDDGITVINSITILP